MKFLRILVAICAPAIWAADVTVVSLFPNDELTVPDAGQLTGRRVNLPMPDCKAQPSTCAEIAALNQLDGFNVNPRIAVAFSGAVDPAAARTSIRGGKRLGSTQLSWLSAP